MQHIPLFVVFLMIGTIGCATSTNDLHADAMGCGKELVIESNGIVREPTEAEKSEQCAPAWKALNERMDQIAKREAEFEAAEAGKCPRGTVKWCDDRFGGKRCSCARNEDVRRALGRIWY